MKGLQVEAELERCGVRIGQVIRQKQHGRVRIGVVKEVTTHYYPAVECKPFTANPESKDERHRYSHQSFNLDGRNSLLSESGIEIICDSEEEYLESLRAKKRK